MNKSKEWYERRRQGITGTDIGAICLLNPYKTPLEVYLDKISEDEHQDITSEPAYWGTRLEDVIADEYAIRQNVQVSIEPNILQHKEYEFMLGSIDRWVNDKEYILECKTIGSRSMNQLGDEGTDQMPSYWLTQIAWYVAITNTPKADVAVLAGGQDFRIYTYERNREFESKLIKVACNFWQNHILKRIPPEATSTDDVLALYPKASGAEVQADNGVASVIETLKYLKEKEKNLNDTIKKLQFEVQDYMKDADILVDNSGRCLATWKNMNPRITLDTKKLQEEHKDIYQQYVQEKEGSRMFLIK